MTQELKENQRRLLELKKERQKQLEERLWREEEEEVQRLYQQKEKSLRSSSSQGRGVGKEGHPFSVLTYNLTKVAPRNLSQKLLLVLHLVPRENISGLAPLVRSETGEVVLQLVFLPWSKSRFCSEERGEWLPRR